MLLFFIKPVIHDRSTLRKRRGGTPHRSISQPIHLGGSFTVAPRKPETHPLWVIPIPYCNYFSILFQNASPCLLRFPLERERLPSPTYLHRSHFSIYGPEGKTERLDIQNG
ncbi:hypothetical protein AVEN_161966-1 [Araneus ventricosus]|uniref:Uncharacterized protein n=1 Tax=Araneus ventricosus TaxID=182803 RepID=A0A4Y2QPP4_ARAVE|nr:hypothetical protein AVEN_161966-1 [Araneus ventricosus]